MLTSGARSLHYIKYIYLQRTALLTFNIYVDVINL